MFSLGGVDIVALATTQLEALARFSSLTAVSALSFDGLNTLTTGRLATWESGF